MLVGVSVPPAQGHWVGGCAGGWVSAVIWAVTGISNNKNNNINAPEVDPSAVAEKILNSHPKSSN